MHHVKFNILLHAQIYVHTAQYTIMKQPILVLMRVPTKLLCVKKYLRTPCAPYYVCAYCARLIHHMHLYIIIFRMAPQFTVHTGTPRFPAWCQISHVRQYANLFQGHSMTLILVTLKLLFCEYSLRLQFFWPIQAKCWTEALIPYSNEPLDQHEARVCHSRETTHSLKPVTNIPSHEVGT